MKENKGITLIALVITIIVLVILAGVTIATLTGKNGILTMASKAKEQTEIAGEKEKIGLAISEAIGFNENGLNETNLQNILDKNLGDGKVIVTYDEEEEMLYVKFIDSERTYRIDKNGNITYIGEESKLILEAKIEATPENNTTPELFQLVDVKTEIPMKVEDEEYSLLYAWSKSKDKMPEDNEFIESNATGTGRIKEVTITSSNTVEGNYYLWVRIIVGDRNKTECFGPYAIKDHTTLITTASENATTSGFLGNANIPRGKIKSINIVTSLEGHTKNDNNTWDVTQSQDGKYLAWYEKDSNGYYSVTIGGNGGVVANSNSARLFTYIGSEVENEEVIIKGLENLDTGLVANMSYMFYNSKVVSLDLNSFNTSNVTSLFSTFQNCTNLRELKVNTWDTSKVTEMGEQKGGYSYGGTFQNCSSLVELDISTWDTSNVVGMGRMFTGCTNLLKLDLSNFDTSNVKSFFGMFENCKTLENIDIKNFNTENALYLNSMFRECTNLLKLDVSKFNTSNATNISYMFYGCTKLGMLDVSNFNTSKVINMNYMFYGCAKLDVLDVSKFDTSKVINMSYMFRECTNLLKLDVSKFNTSNVTDMSYMFYGCTKLGVLDVSNFDTSNVTNMNSMFQKCSGLTVLDVSKFDTSKVTKTDYMFAYCSSLTTLNLGNFDTSSITNWMNMFISVPKSIKITTTNDTTQEWLKEKFSITATLVKED